MPEFNVQVKMKPCGGKGNAGHFIDREPRVCPAGLPTAQPEYTVDECLRRYTLQDQVDALISDTIHPPVTYPRPLRPRSEPDMRHAIIQGGVAHAINPEVKTKFQTIIDELKETSYASYWCKVTGRVRDPVPNLPPGLDRVNTTFGKKTKDNGRLYDVLLPSVPLPDATPYSKYPGVQKRRDYKPPFDDMLTWGMLTHADKRGRQVKCAVTDERRILGIDNKAVVSSIMADRLKKYDPIPGEALTPNNNISCVPQCHAFGIPTTLDEGVASSMSERNPKVIQIKHCVEHLNKVRGNLAKRLLPSYMHKFYLQLKYIDHEKNDWLPTKIVYNECSKRLIRFDPDQVNPLLELWGAMNGDKINYKFFLKLLNPREHFPELPKMMDVSLESIHYETTYREMVKPGQCPDPRPPSGIPSARIDLDFPDTPGRMSKADRKCLPHESSVRSGLNPSMLTLFNLNHRDMYASRDREVVRTVFENAKGEPFSDDQFERIWQNASKLHSTGSVCFETFRKCLDAGDIS